MQLRQLFKPICSVLGILISVTGCQEIAPSSVESQGASSTIPAGLVPFTESRDGFSKVNSLSWDGRLYSGTTEYNYADMGTSIGVISVGVFRPEVMKDGDIPAAGFPSAVLSPGTMPLYDLAVTEPNGHVSCQPISIVPYPGTTENPYRSESNGGKDPRGNYETYDAVVLSYQLKNTPVGQAPDDNYLVRGRWLITVQNPRTETAVVSRVQTINDFAPMKTESSNYIYGLEPTATADGRLVVYQSKGGNLSYTWLADPTVNSHLQVWANPKGLAQLNGDANTMVAGLSFRDRYPLSRQLLLDASGATFTANYHGAYPWISADGSEVFHTTLPSSCTVHPATDMGTPDTTNSGRRGGTAVIGLLTNYAQRYIDGPNNPNLYVAPRQTMAPLGPFPGMWAPFLDMPTSPLPTSPRRSLYADFDHFTKTYTEIAFDDAKDPDYLIYLHMNQMISQNSSRDGQNAFTKDAYSTVGMTVDGPSDVYLRTPDSSGSVSGPIWQNNLNNGLLWRGAHFPAEPPSTVGSTSGCYQSANIGKSGQAIYFPLSSSVFIANNAQNLNRIQDRLSVQLWFQSKNAAACAGQSIVSAAGQYVLSVEGGHLFAKVTLRGTGAQVSLRSNSTTANVLDGDFHAIGLSYDANTSSAAGGTLKLYIDGVLNSSASTTGVSGTDRYVAVGGSTLSVVLGPNPSVTPPGSTPPPSCDANDPTGCAIYILDEFALSAVARTDAEFQTAAFLKPAVPSATDRASSAQAFAALLPAGLPLGLSGLPVQIPTSNAISSGAVSLGQQLFSDKILSQNFAGNPGFSCASCHLAASAFSDTVQFSLGYSGTKGKRNAPSLFNRVFSTLQMRDGSADSLETQVLLPLHSESEMGLSTDDRRSAMVTRVKLQYGATFDQVYASSLMHPWFANLEADVAETYITRALASYERTLVSGNSRIDQFEARNVTGANLSPQEQLGRVLFHNKARCISCHNGPNYTDELFHDSGFFDTHTTDHGRGAVTLRSGDMNRFRTPSLRNISLTGPYFHDGSFADLASVVDHYDLALSNDSMADPLLFRLNLSDDEKAALVAFLLALQSNP